MTSVEKQDAKRGHFTKDQNELMLSTRIHTINEEFDDDVGNISSPLISGR